MNGNTPHLVQQEIAVHGYCTVENIYTEKEIDQLLAIIAGVDSSGPAFRKTDDLFAIRRFMHEIPGSTPTIFNDALLALIDSVFDKAYFVVKSIYFDKPERSNWFVAWHQDLTISVDKKMDTAGYGPWTTKQNQFAVQPPLSILEDNFTIRIHLDDTDENNGALKVVPGSHRKGIYRPETIDWNKEVEHTCPVPAGGIMIMKPLLLHASSRSTNNKKRRVVHIEFSRSELADGMNWAEYLSVPSVG